MQVEVEDDDGTKKWHPATVTAVLVDSWLQMEIRVPGDSWVDWFTWQEEGTDWRRKKVGGGRGAAAAAAAKAVRAPAAAASAPKKAAAPPAAAPPAGCAGSGGGGGGGGASVVVVGVVGGGGDGGGVRARRRPGSRLPVQSGDGARPSRLYAAVWTRRRPRRGLAQAPRRAVPGFDV